jgi:hypothetical protein
MRALLATLLHCRIFAAAVFGLIYVVLLLHVLGRIGWFNVRGINSDMLEHDMRYAGVFALVFICSAFLVFFGSLLIDRGSIDTAWQKDSRIKDVVSVSILAVAYWLWVELSLIEIFGK